MCYDATVTVDGETFRVSQCGSSLDVRRDLPNKTWQDLRWIDRKVIDEHGRFAPAVVKAIEAHLVEAGR